jgi:hypothetical protein
VTTDVITPLPEKVKTVVVTCVILGKFCRVRRHVSTSYLKLQCV